MNAKLPEQGHTAALDTETAKFAMASYVDIHGVIKGKFVPVAHLDRMLGGSELYTGAALDGVPQDINDDEVAAMPDPASATTCSWNPELVWYASDLYLNGKPFEACSRSILKRQIDAAAEMGFTFNLGIETEFFVFKRTEDGGFAPFSDRDVLDKPCYDPRPLMDNLPIIKDIVEAMDVQGWDVYSFDHEDANGQFETDFMYTDALNMADRLVYFRMMANEVARKHGAFASFMAKPFADRTGSGAHYNMSLADKETGKNLFEANDNDPHGCGVSPLAYHFIAGILKHARAICSVIAPTVNSYKRLVQQGAMSGSTWAPVYCCYGNNNRTNMLRIPSQGGRVECRAPDISCNPYLGAAMMLAAGLEGIREKLEPGEPHRENMNQYSRKEIRDMGIELLPRTLGEAVDAFEADPLSREVFGELMFDTFADFKRNEWEAYHNHVSDWEVERYLTMF
ncbi:type III glutamate--ammonia ligase [Alcanivorax sp.]|uniref:type III glutamate--ammonia ligase n=1 Tax=Alcanivorax sp. TaxID=1872427 RepID=UPI000C4B2E7A|nr:type III glutamate--ammonia ligase [Alcanivorax sp.]MBQ23711.1 type III glutamate--ammonia ligase [Alcanivorax sp.]|tara:strand:- start:2999 stop:4357 length:1359 start_codon:yes stop_codon:yes gene_type:complete